MLGVIFYGLFGSGLSNAITEFQKFCALPADGYAGKQVWASLLVSTGDKNRKGKACDCSETITPEKAESIKSNGYEVVGRYLTGKFQMTSDEIETIFSNGLRLFPIFEVGGYQNSYFNASQGSKDAISAINAAINLGFGDGTIIYFAVDYDAYGSNITDNIMPYFSAVKSKFDTYNPHGYKIGIYAPRHICTLALENGYTCSSFVCDMSSGFSGNLGFPLPKDWAFDQISTISIGSGSGSIEIDNNICSNKYIGASSVSKTDSVLIFQSSRSFRTNADGTYADDLKINDFTKDELLEINSLFQYQLDESDNPDSLFKEQADMSTTFFSTGEMESVILDMINHFKAGQGEDYSNEILTKHVVEHENTTKYVDDIKNALIDQLKANNGDLQALRYVEGATNPLYDYIKELRRPIYNNIGDKVEGLTITIDDIWGNNVEVRNYSLNSKHFNGTLHFNIYDHFGLDKPDVEKIYVNLAGFRAWFILQHYDKFKGKYKPFVTVVEFDVPFEGDLN